MKHIRFLLRTSAILGLSLLWLFSCEAQEQRRDMATPGEIRLSPGQLKTYEGYYQFSKNEDVKIRLILVGNELHLKPIWNDVDIRLVPVSDSVFSSGNGENGERQNITFIRDAHGEIQRFTNGGENYFNRMEKRFFLCRIPSCIFFPVNSC